MARPSEYRPEYADQLIEFMSRGMLLEDIASAWNVAPRTLLNWRNEQEDFQEAYEIGLVKCYSWWTTEGKKRFEEGNDKGFKYWMAVMNAKFGWNKQETNVQNITNIHNQIGNVNVISNKGTQELAEFILEKLDSTNLIEDVQFTVEPPKVKVISREEDQTGTGTAS